MRIVYSMQNFAALFFLQDYICSRWAGTFEGASADCVTDGRSDQSLSRLDSPPVLARGLRYELRCACVPRIVLRLACQGTLHGCIDHSLSFVAFVEPQRLSSIDCKRMAKSGPKKQLQENLSRLTFLRYVLLVTNVGQHD